MNTKALKKEKNIQVDWKQNPGTTRGLKALSTCPSPFPSRPQGACVTSHEETAGRSFPIHVYLLLLLFLFSFSPIIFLFFSLIFRSFFRFLLEYLVSLLSFAMLTQSNVSFLLERHLILS